MTNGTSLLTALDTFLATVTVGKSAAEVAAMRVALESAARSAEGEIRGIYISAIGMLRAGVSAERVRVWLKVQDADAAVRDLAWEDHDRELLGIGLALAAAFLVAMRLGAATYGGANGSEAAALTLVRAAAMEWAEQRAAAAVQDISEGTRAAIRSTIARIFRDGLSVDEAAAEITASIGMSAQQAEWLGAFRDRMAADGTLSAADQRAAAQAYARELVAERAQRIAETESWAAAQTGLMESWGLLDGLGILDEGMVMAWRAKADACAECRVLHGTEIPIGGSFRGSGGGIFDGPPAHPNCRCHVELVPATENLLQ